MNQFYTFGWNSEKIYDVVRSKAAKNLVDQLQTLVIEYYKQHKIIPKIRLLGYSHGGNVALNTACYLPLKVNDEKVQVETWLFGTPVLTINSDFVNSENFTKIYSIFSKKDWIQRMDPQGLRNIKKAKNNFWSNRTFNESDRCLQVDLMVNGRGIGHINYIEIFEHFFQIKKLVEENSQGKNSGMITVNLQLKNI